MTLVKKAQIEQFSKLNPLERLGQPEDIAIAWVVASARQRQENAMTMLTNVEATKFTKTEQFRYQDAHLEIDLAEKFAVIDSRRLRLTRKEYQLLVVLVENAGKPVAREVLLMRVWGYGDGIRTRTLDVHIRRLRIQFGSYSEQYIETVFGMGYKFQPIPRRRGFSL